MGRFFIALFAGFLAIGLGIQEAEAKRLGGGMSRGMQRDSVTQRQAVPQPGTPSQQAAPAPQGSPAAAAQPQRRSWLGPIAGLAAGLGLAALFSHLGLSEELANFFMIALLVVAVIFVAKLVFRRERPKEAMQFAGLGNATPGRGQSLGVASIPSASVAASGKVGAEEDNSRRSVPAGFDAEGFVRVAKVNFLRLQAANDAADLEDIREFTTPEMFAEIKVDIDERRGSPQHTDVLKLEAELLEATTERDRHLASVRFHGMIREEKAANAEAFDEVWNLVKPADGSRGWQVAGIQQLH